MPLQAFAGWVRPNPQQQNVTQITVADSPYAVAPLDVFIGVDSSGGAVTVNLPPAASYLGRVIEVYDVSGTASANTITIDASGGETISGSLTRAVTTSYGGLTIVSTGTNWEILATAGAAATSVLTLVETKTLVAVASVTFAGLNGDTDLVYLMEGETTVAGAGTQIEFLVNGGSSAAALSVVSVNSGTGIVSGAASSSAGNLRIPAGGSFAPTERLWWSCRIDAARGAALGKQSFQFEVNQATTVPSSISQQIGAFYLGAPANLTSLQVTNTAGSTLTGKISLYKLSRT